MDELNLVKRDFHKDYNGIYLNDAEVNILKNNGINIANQHSLKQLMFDLENIIDEEENEELEMVLDSIAEFNYYHNTNKQFNYLFFYT